MEEPKEVQEMETISPTGEVVSPEVKNQAEEVPAGPAPAEAEEDHELLALQMEVEAAQTPEEKKIAEAKWRGAWARIRNEAAASRRAATEAEKKAEFERGRAEGLKDRADEIKKPKVEEPVYVTPDFLEPRPKLEDFEYDEEQMEAAREDWVAKKAQHYAYHQLKAEQQKEQWKRDQDAALTNQEKQEIEKKAWVEKGTTKYPDFRKVLEEAPPVSQTLAQAVLAADNSSDIAYYLAKNQVETQRIAGMGPVAQAIEIGKLAYKLSLPPAKSKTISGAPVPITVTGKAETSGTVDIYKPETPMEEYAAVHPLLQKK